ncbi:PTS ascorbate transporter subunit IIC [Aureibacillus halotolerans]|uniref:Ascorbate-specific PTS system EIIC component n=1 Tax=Aureibacillus halotolerans TaxID=1508390 RepID=A0A4R6U8A1_9BACI|nr:PTS ascorbate transporter subunit IIC [Aureibacillus halotolerans]TDQ42800.1 PTS system IIC component (L-Asc family) [Aureibacillus halotolerans]
MDIILWIAQNIFVTPAVLLGLIVLIGLLLQKKGPSQVISGTFKTIIGFLIINAGAGVIAGTLGIFEPMWKEVFNLESTALSDFMGQDAFSNEFGSMVAMAMTLGFLINVLLARFTKAKYIYLTGHMMFWTAMIFTGIVVNTVGTDVNFWGAVILLAVVLGIYWTVQPALTQPILRKITGNDNIALGHTSASVALLGALGGKLFGNKENDAEKLKLPKGLEFLRDSNVITALTMGILFVIGAIVVMTKSTPGAQELVASAGSQNFIVFAMIQSFTFAAGIAVVLMGVRMFIGELVPAFKGIATKIVPGAKPAFDVPIIFPFAPNAVVLGFLGAFVGALIWLVIIGNTVAYIFVPTMIVLFFHGAAAGVFGNATGGVRGALLGGFLTATVVAWGQYLMVTTFIGKTIPDTAMWAADSDMFILGPIVSFLAQLLL